MKKILTLIAAVSLFSACMTKTAEVTEVKDTIAVTETDSTAAKVDSIKTTVDSAASLKMTPVVTPAAKVEVKKK